MTLGKDQLTAAEKAILGKCGVFCPACDAYLGKAKGFAKDIFDNLGLDEGKIKDAAKNLLEIMDQVNYDDVVGFLNLGVNIKEYEKFKRFLKIIAESKIALEGDIDIKAFQKVLRKFVSAPNCTGCGTGAGAAKICPVVLCCETKGYLTCAECPDIQNHSMCKTINEKQIPSMITDNITYFKLITQRYSHWNVENLKKIIRKGYKQYIKEMKEKCAKGFYSGQVICKDRVFRDLLGF
ncbi:MAG: DUF3795 domain-containing protein [Candidatus Helarchaeota archaeon]|nr:DUF3795 domain-containing protein [Candidatus Helarchaeota archaeon]